MPKMLMETINPVDFFCDPPYNKRLAMYNSVFKTPFSIGWQKYEIMCRKFRNYGKLSGFGLRITFWNEN